MNIFWIYKSIFTVLTIGLFIFSLRRSISQLISYSKKYDKIPNGVKLWMKDRAKTGVKKGISENKFLIILNIILFIILIIINVFVWMFRFD